MISMARVDDRLIHGQVAVKWCKELAVTRIIVAKNRSGPIGDVDLVFVPKYTKFYEVDSLHED